MSNPLPVGAASRRDTGMGVRGMRQRAELLGGTISAGPGDDGWTVRAEFPLDTAGCTTFSTILPGLLRGKPQEDA